ncbi:transposase [Phytohabitans kaempferiae]|uniref:Transposase n=1 Tax=Phytohabitans kaempferiae TaxID=1620943 RepID=A0ABV6M1Z8_9ACTN
MTWRGTARRRSGISRSRCCRRTRKGTKAAAGRRTDDRAMLAAIVYVLESGCSWRKLPRSFPVHWRTAHRRFAEWVALGVMTAVHQAMLDVLGLAGQIDWSRASIDSMQPESQRPARSR